VPNETVICKFRHLLERNKLGIVLLKAANDHPHRSCIKITKRTIVDATIIGPPSSTRYQDGQRDPEMHQTAKGQQWYFGMRAYVGVDSKTKLVHTVLASAANVHDRGALPNLLHGNETRVWGDRGHQGQTAVIHQRAPNAKDFNNRRYRHHGLAKNLNRLEVTAALANLYVVRRRIAESPGQGVGGG
jgi:IS5 family transposase